MTVCLFHYIRHNFNPLRREGGDYPNWIGTAGMTNFNPLRREGGDNLPSFCVLCI